MKTEEIAATTNAESGATATPHPDTKVVIIGAGPAGLTAASKLVDAGTPTVVLEKDHIVGGISRTESHNGYLFDIGGHRFFTKVRIVEDMWHEVLKDDMLLRSRISRILYNRKFFDYPLRIFNALFGLGIWTSTMVLISYIMAHVFPIKDEKSFEDWVTNRFGRRLYRVFFKTYTEKVWGIPCNEISADWAAQRIKGLSLKTALKNALLGSKGASKQEVVKTLIDSFHYPKFGPGMMWERVADSIRDRGTDLRMETEVIRMYWSENGVEKIETRQGGADETIEGSHFISSMPIRELIRCLDPAPPTEVMEAARRLRYRDFLTVALVIDREHLFYDNWIYVHDDSVKVGRVQNFKNWSPHMVPDPSKTCLGLEYFCFENDELWSMKDQDLIELATQEMDALGLVKRSEVEDGAVVRMPKAYPVYDEDYAEAVDTIRQFLAGIENLQLVGRNGMHKYNNQDHSMLTAMLAVDNIRGAEHDLWAVNADQDYHEEVSREELERSGEYAALASTQPLVPGRLDPETISDRAIQKMFARLDKAALAASLGTVAGSLITLATMWVVFRSGPESAPHLDLLAQYFMGYSVTYKGALVGFLYGFFWGFMFGWTFAYLRNLMLGLYVRVVKGKAQSTVLSHLLDYI